MKLAKHGEMWTKQRNYAEHLKNLLGYYEFGGIPTVIDPLQSGSKDTDLTNVHEQSHRDLINNTLYGYAIVRLLHLSHLSGLDKKSRREFKQAFKTLSERLFLCAEGLAVALEIFIAKHTDGGVRLNRLLARLPTEYKEALDQYRPLLSLNEESTSKEFDFSVRQALICAIAENSLDWSILTSLSTPIEFRELVAKLVNSDAPDDVLGQLVSIARKIPIQKYPGIMKALGLIEFDEKDKQFDQLVRTLIQAYREFIFRVACSRNTGVPMLKDFHIIYLKAYIDKALVKQYPNLQPIRWRPGRIFGEAVQVELKKPEFQLEEEVLDKSELLSKM